MDQRCPGGGFLTVTELPGDHLGAVVGHQHAVTVEIGAIQHQIPVDLAGRCWCRWRDVPTPLGAPVECALAQMCRHHTGQDPVEKPVQLMAPGHISPSVGPAGTCPAVWSFAPKPLGAFWGFSVGSHRLATYRTVGFFTSKSHLHRLPPMTMSLLPHDHASRAP